MDSSPDYCHLVLVLCNHHALTLDQAYAANVEYQSQLKCPWLLQEDGLAAMDRLSASFKKFDGLLEAKDKQAIPGAHKIALQSTLLCVISSSISAVKDIAGVV